MAFVGAAVLAKFRYKQVEAADREKPRFSQSAASKK
jgi:hypothetical protein